MINIGGTRRILDDGWTVDARLAVSPVQAHAR
jgi:hypothetical protein